MHPVEIVPIENSLVLRARGSELLILPQHVGHLKSCKTPKDFTGYFLGEALLNRPARKLFEAWLRKDTTLWQRIYNTVQKEMGDVPAEPAVTQKTVVSKPEKATVVAPPKEAKQVKKVEEKEVAAPTKKVVAKKAEKKEEPVVKEAKPAKKAAVPKAGKAKTEKSAAKPAKKAAAPAKKKPAAKSKKKG